MKPVTKYESYDGKYYDTEEECSKADEEHYSSLIVIPDVQFPFQNAYDDVNILLLHFNQESDLECVMAISDYQQEIYGDEKVEEHGFPCDVYAYNCEAFVEFYLKSEIDEKLKAVCDMTLKENGYGKGN